jgi:AAA15 family ATPase/GTPase
MKIRKITTIKSYKSFSDFSWAKFCKNASSQEEVLQKFSIIFGENGSGKSAICDVLKSVSQTQGFQNIPPTSAELEISDGSNNQSYKYENGNWKNQVGQNTFLFFDVDFVNANVHTHGVISSNLQQGAHTQKAGKLIIDLDEQANNLKEAAKAKKDKLEALQKSCSDILERQFTDKDQDFFRHTKTLTKKLKKKSWLRRKKN